MAHKKAGGSTRNGRDSESKRLGVKMYGGQVIKAGDDRVEIPGRLDGAILVASQPGDSRIRLRQSAAGQDQAIGLLFVGERKARMLQRLDLTFDQVLLA